MKRTLATLVMAFGLGSLLAVAPVSAQSNPAVADIPFSFVTSGRVLHAGKYNISQLSYSSAVFVLKNENGGTIMTQLAARQDGHAETPSLTFTRNGGAWMLVKVTPPYSSVSYSLGGDATEHHGTGVAAMISIKLK